MPGTFDDGRLDRRAARRPRGQSEGDIRDRCEGSGLRWPFARGDRPGEVAPVEALLLFAALMLIARAGDGNMNCTLRASLGGRTLILKQSRPYVAKYPSIPAPLDRAIERSRDVIGALPEV